MTLALDQVPPYPSRTASLASAGTGLVGVAGLASLGAGAVHAAAIGVHSEHRSAVLAFTAVAALQLGWGAVALVRRGRLVNLVGAVVAVGALGGWALAKTTGIPGIAGLEEAEAVQTADGLAAGFALASLVVLVVAAVADRRGTTARVVRLPAASVAVAALAVFGMVSAGSHAHAGGHAGAAADHHGGESTAAGADHHGGDTTAAAAHVEGDGHDEGEHAAAVVPPVPYHPDLPIDLGGVEGVTPEQQAAAENIVAVTLHGLPQWSDPEVALAAGFRSIGDGGTGVEHFVHQANMEDPTMFDPDVPESLVYDTSEGGRRLVAAMYMTTPGVPLDEVDNPGGALMQWHTHDNLCYNAEGKVRGLTDAAGNCPAGLVKPVETPMIHVWIEPHPCGPFAALEGIGGGRIPDGEARLCDTAHGSH